MEENENNDAKLKDDIDKSMLPRNVIEAIKECIENDFDDDNLGLWLLNIDDSIMLELSDWIVKLQNNYTDLINHRLGENKLTSIGANILIEALMKQKCNLEAIFFNSNELDDGCMDALGQYIKSNEAIICVDLENNLVTDKGITILAPYLQGNSRMEIIVLGRNEGVTDESVPILKKIIESSSISNLNISGTSITNQKVLLLPIVENVLRKGLDSINLEEKNLDKNDLLNICELMKHYGVKLLKEIDVSSNDLGFGDISILIKTLIELNSNVERLELQRNNFGDECVPLLLEYIESNPCLESLSIGRTKITDKGIEKFRETLTGNITLKSLSIYANEGITDASAPFLIEMAKTTHLSDISTTFLPISQENKLELQRRLDTPCEEREIPIKSQSKSAAKILQ